jgi:NAD-dependent deacetylase
VGRDDGAPIDLVERLAAARRVVVFTGAGVSQESGLATFRSAGGLWERFRAEDLATPEAFGRDPELVWRWYRERFESMRRAAPNAAHRTIASWNRRFPSLSVVTQNIDRLHQRAGSPDVLELHGTIWRVRCVGCGGEADTEAALAAEPPARCACGARQRPAVVWFGESLPAAALDRAARRASESDVLLSVGTSATVYPAAGLIEVAAGAGATVVEVNREPTPLSALAAFVLRGAAGEVLPALERALARRDAGTPP